MNHITLMGRFTKDPINAVTAKGIKQTKFTLAVDDGKTKEGEKLTQFINCVAWEQTADSIAKFFNEGRRILVEGKLTIRKYEKDGKIQYFTEVVVNRFYFADDKQKSEEHKDEPNFNTGKLIDIESDDLPF